MRVVLVALAFHLEHTRSSDFFIETLRSAFEDFYVVADTEAWYEIPRLRPDILVFWQKLLSPVELDSFGARSVVLVPMYDACPHDRAFWESYRAYKVLCFSRALYNLLDGWGFQALAVQYWIRPKDEVASSAPGLRAFYWERSRLIDWNCVRSLLAEAEVDRLHFHRASGIVGANARAPSDEDVQRYKIEYSDWFDSRDRYFEVLRDCSLYFAPREAEGIGLSFIEAMALGLCVVAPRAPTMDEYIVDGVNGLLYDPKNPEALCFEALATLRARALEDSKRGNEDWLESVPLMLRFISEPAVGYVPVFRPWVFAKRRARALVRRAYKSLLGLLEKASRVVVLCRPVGQHSNQLLQHATLYAYCRGRGFRFVDLNARTLLRSYSSRTAHRRGGLLDGIIAATLLGLERLHIIRIVDFSRQGKIEEFEERCRSGRPSIVRGWGLESPLSLAREREHFRDLCLLPLGEAWESLLRSGPVLGLHIRRGDYAEFEGGRFFYSDSQYLKVAQRARERLGIEGLRTILFTNDDNLDFEIYKAKLGDCFLSREPYQIDHALMARCDYLIGPPSTFTQWASYIGSVPLYAIRDPAVEPGVELFKVFPETA